MEYKSAPYLRSTFSAYALHSHLSKPENETIEHLTEQELTLLRNAIDLARQARQDGRHPFGALIVNERGETVVAARNNAVRPAGDPTQHAEMVACAG